jgi:hypothetical protein
MNYDTFEGISVYLADGLPGLARLAKHRRTAGYDRRERLKEWIIRRRYILDTCGNTSIILEPTNFERLVYDMPDVCEREALGVHMRHIPDSLSISSTDASLPPLDDICPHCLRGWHLHNSHDVTWNRYYTEAHHIECYRLIRHTELVKSFIKVFFDAGFEIGPDAFLLRAVPNEYWKSGDHGPWFIANFLLIDTDGRLHGRRAIRIGWRKRVIQIDWSPTGLALPDLFHDEDVTRGDTHIHAWGSDKASAYLTRLRGALLAHAKEQAP